MLFHKLGIFELGAYLEHDEEGNDDIVLVIDITPKQVIMHELNENLYNLEYSYFNLEDYSYDFIGPAKSFDEARQLYPEYFL